MDLNRREFIKNSASTFFIAAAGNAVGIGAPSNRVRLAIVGCQKNGRGFAVMKSAMKLPGVEIACVCDVDSRAREEAADYIFKQTGLKPYTEKDLRKILEDPSLDGILSETPDHIHAYSAIMALKAGKAVYVEKPCCFCPAEGQILMRVAQETRGILQVGSQRRASLSYRAALNWLKETQAIGHLRYAKAWYVSNRASIGVGKKSAVPEWLDWNLWQGPAPREDFRDNIVHYNWHWFRKWGTSEMGNNAPHFIDVSRWALGLDEFPETIQCTGGLCFPKGGDFEWPDIFNAAFKYSNGKIITFEMSCHNATNPYRGVQTGAMVYGERGALYLGANDEAIVYNTEGEKIKAWQAGGIDEAQGLISTSNPTEKLDLLHLANFVDCLRTKNAATNVDAEQGVKSSVLPLLANLAVDEGETIRLDPRTGTLLSKAGTKGWAREYEPGWELT